MMKITGIFQITNWQESTIQPLKDGGKITQATVNQSYQGDITGESQVHFHMVYQANGDANFIGFESFEAQLGSEPCQLTLKHDGKFEQGVASSQFLILASTSHQNLIGKTGSFQSTENGQANYIIE